MWWRHVLSRLTCHSHERALMLITGTSISQNESSWEMTNELIFKQLAILLAFMTVNGPCSFVHFSVVVMMIVGWLGMAKRCLMAHSDSCCWLLFDLWLSLEVIFVCPRVHPWPILVFPPRSSMAPCATRARKTPVFQTCAAMAVVEAA
jgi:hypothetical protein